MSMKGTATRLNDSGSLVVLIGNKQQAVSPSEIIYLAGDSNYSRLIRSKKPPVTVSITLSRYETILPGFIRVHKQYIVNPSYIKRLIQDGPIRDGATIQLLTGDLLPISRRRIRLALELLLKHRQQTV